MENLKAYKHIGLNLEEADENHNDKNRRVMQEFIEKNPCVVLINFNKKTMIHAEEYKQPREDLFCYNFDFDAVIPFSDSHIDDIMRSNKFNSGENWSPSLQSTIIDQFYSRLEAIGGIALNWA